MLSLVSLFWNICLTRKGPEDVPAQYALIALLIIGKLVLFLGVSTIRGNDLDALALVTQVVIWSAIVGLLTGLALQLRGLFSRFGATFGAILGSELLMTALYFVVILAVSAVGIDANLSLVTLFTTIISVWTIFIVGFIMHRALNINILLGITVGLFIMIASLSISTEVAKLA